MNIADVMDELGTALEYVPASSSFVGTVRYNWNGGTVAGWTGDSATASNVGSKLRLSSSLGSGSVNMRKDDAGTLAGGTLSGSLIRFEATLVADPGGTWTAKAQWQNQAFSYQDPTSVSYTRVDTGASVSGLILNVPVYVTCTFASITLPRAFALQVDGAGATAGTVTVDIDNFSQGSIVETPAAGVDGLRVYPYWEDSPQSPAAIVAWPDPIEYDLTMGRGSDALELDVIVAVARMDPRAARDQVARYLDGAGDHSIKAALENGTYAACDTVVVTTARIDEMTMAGVECLGIVFRIQITGNGA